MRGLGMSGKLYLGVTEGNGVEPLEIITSTPLDCKKTLFESQSTSYLR